MEDNIDNKMIEEARKLARKYNQAGWGSRASVLHAVYDLFETDIPEKMFIRLCGIIDGFQGVTSGIYEHGKSYGATMCGALSGGIAAFGMVHGWREFPYRFWTEGMKSGGWISDMMEDSKVTKNDKARAFIEHCKPLGYGGYYQIAARFKEHYGTTDCLDLVRPYGEYVNKDCFKNCHKIIIWTAGMVAHVIMEYKINPDSLEIDERNPLLYLLEERADESI